jgi:hypothetical protein
MPSSGLEEWDEARHAVIDGLNGPAPPASPPGIAHGTTPVARESLLPKVPKSLPCLCCYFRVMVVGGGGLAEPLLGLLGTTLLEQEES